MSTRKQTMWLVTMLSLLVVLSVYYLFYVDDGSHTKEIASSSTDTAHQASGERSDDTSTSPNTAVDDVSGAQTVLPADDDYFAAVRLERDQARAKEMERYFNMLGSQDNQSVKEASARLDVLEERESKELVVESLIKAKGYRDAVVMAGDKRVNVVVRAEALKPEDVVDIIQLVTSNMDVRGTDVTVSTRP
ncbi:MAG: SpoIIIAH-like family protein [Hydrogenibacillus sp.]|nr:SpoIIIAH-like family protein [Hydrogenibacillus sp.]